MFPAHRAPLGLSLLAGALIAAFLLQSFFASRAKSPVFDEPAHIAAGLSYVQTGVFVANPQHPPLLKEMAALSLLLAGVRWPGTPQAQQLINGAGGLEWPIGNAIIADNGPDEVMFWSRLPFILLATLLAVLVYLWGRKLVGDLAAMGALFLYALDPTVLAHSFLVTTDVGFAAFTVLFFVAIWNYLRRPNPKRLLLCGVAMGLVLGTKFSAVFLLPVAAFLLLAAVRWPPEPAPGHDTGDGGSAESNLNSTGALRSPAHPQRGSKVGPNNLWLRGSGKKRKTRPGPPPQATPSLDQRSGLGRKFAACAGAFLAMCLVAMVVIQALYFSSSGLSLYTTGLQQVNADHNPHYLVFMSGQLAHRFSSYFAVAYLLKEPIASIVLVGLGLIAVVRSKTITLLPKLFLLLPPAVSFAAYTIWADNIGIRYIIPVLPFAYLAGGVGLAVLIRSGARW
ncbi:MAG: glycosyltransferase family 39 protein, partial [Acidobacteria bacterium]|nr:glycosyltransferase family 39 protein [Acidobacteriota bacterium]